MDTITLPSARPSRAATFDDCVHYEPMHYAVLFRYLEPLQAGPNDVVYDVGSGMGRVLLVFARKGVRKCVGIEIAPSLAEIAEANAIRVAGARCPIETRVQDAAGADYADGTIYLFHNPFGADTLRAVLARIHESLLAQPRRVQVAYFVPRQEHVLRDCGWLRLLGRKSSLLHRSGASYWVYEP